MNEKLEEAVRELLEIVKRKIEEAKPPVKKDSWDHAKVIAQWIAAIAIPIVLALGSHWVTLSIKTSETSTKMVELAVKILGSDPKQTQEDKKIRQWSLNVIEEYSGVKIPEEAKVGFETSRFPVSRFGGIVGKDDRVIVQDTSQSPWNSISQLKLKNGWGSGFLVHPRIVVAPKYLAKESEFNEVSIYVGRNGDNIPNNPVTPIKIVHRSEDDDPLDIAFFILPKGLTLPAPSYTFSKIGDKEILNSEIHFAGYSGDKNNRMITSIGKALKVNAVKIFHDLDTGSGSGGGPLWITKNNRNIVIGVHLATGSAGSQGKTAVRINQSDLDKVIDSLDR